MIVMIIIIIVIIIIIIINTYLVKKIPATGSQSAIYLEEINHQKVGGSKPKLYIFPDTTLNLWLVVIVVVMPSSSQLRYECMYLWEVGEVGKVDTRLFKGGLDGDQCMLCTDITQCTHLHIHVDR